MKRMGAPPWQRCGSQSDLAVASLQAQLAHRKREMQWRGPVEYQLRHTLAWLVNVAVILISLFLSLIYALKFNDKATKQMAVAWLVAYGVTFAIVEPLQVIILVCAPAWLFDDDNACGRAMNRIRFIYNELCAP